VEYLVPITIAVVEIIKRTGYAKDNWIPIISVLVGAVLGYYAGFTGLDLLIVGLAGSGLYDLGKPGVTRVVERIKS